MKKAVLLIGMLVGAISIMAQGKVSVTIDEVESGKGKIIICLYTSGDGFPKDWSKAAFQKRISAVEGEMTYTFEEVPFGTYAVSIAHDENDDGELDTNFMGFPKEKVGASFQKSLGKPSFDKSKFELSKASPHQELKMNFLN